jgi:hypothetical protein
MVDLLSHLQAVWGEANCFTRFGLTTLERSSQAPVCNCDKLSLAQQPSDRRERHNWTGVGPQLIALIGVGQRQKIPPGNTLSPRLDSYGLGHVAASDPRRKLERPKVTGRNSISRPATPSGPYLPSGGVTAM